MKTFFSEHVNSPINQLPDFSKTLLIPLYVRYLETKRIDGILKDQKSVEIFESLSHSLSVNLVSDRTRFIIAVKTRVFEEQISKFLKRHPESVVVNLGCGLDTRFINIDNGQVIWYDIDIPEVIQLKKHFFSETTRYRLVGKSVLDFSWLDIVEEGKPTLFIAEGLLMYFFEDEVKKLVLAIQKQFRQADYLFEVVDEYVVKNSHRDPELKKFNVQFRWGVSNSRVFEQWSRGIRYIEEWNCYDMLNRYPKRWKLFRILGILFPFLRKGVRVVHLKLCQM